MDEYLWGGCYSYIRFDPSLEVHNVFHYVRGASKIKVKSMYKKRMATARRLIFLEFLKASIADLVTLLFSS